MEIFRCLNCMHEMDADNAVCPACGYDNSAQSDKTYSLLPNTILHGRYLVGNMLGQGGFGITYIGFDLVLNIKVAIKEYFPRSAASRDNRIGQEIFWSTEGGSGISIEEGRNSFLEEARRMAKIDTIPEIVRIRDTFEENRSVYIIMDYVNGVTLKKYVTENGVMDISECLELLHPLLTGLSRVHEHGIIHRDISPDNIMLEQDGGVRLLDLGAAADVGSTGSRYQAVAKQGFSPIEQYSPDGDTGQWTDVYSICATIYYCVTGKVIPAAGARESSDPLPAELMANKALSPGQKNALLRGLAVMPGDRTRSVKELMKQLGMDSVTAVNKYIRKAKSFVMKHKLPSAAALIVAVLAVYLLAAKPWVVTVQALGQLNSNVRNGGGFALIENEHAYFLMENGSPSVYYYDEATDSYYEETFLESVTSAGNFTVGGDKVYFTSADKQQTLKVPVDGTAVTLSYNTVYSMNHDGTGVTKLFTGLGINTMQYAKLSNGREMLYFLEFDTKGNNPLYSYDIASGKKSVVCDFDTMYWYNVYDRYVYYTRSDGARPIFARCSLKGGKEKILDSESYYINGVMDDSGSYMLSLNTNTLYGVDKDGTRTGASVPDIDVDNETGACRYAVGEGLVYYVSSSDKSLHRIDPELGNTVISDDVPEEMCLAGDFLWISDIASDRTRLSATLFHRRGSGMERFDMLSSWEDNIMAAQAVSPDFYGISGSDIETVTFLSDLRSAPESVYDLSESGDGSVLAWLSGTDLYIGANGGINGALAAKYLFNNLESLRQVRFNGNFHTDYAESMFGMFVHCEKLESVDVQSLKTDNVSDFGSMFSNCKSLQELDLSGFNTSKATSMYSMFFECFGLQTLDLSSFDTSQVTNMLCMFCGCEGLTSLDLSSFDTSQVTNMEAMFFECFGLQTLDLSSFDTSQVTNMQAMFYGCEGLTSLDLSSFDTSQVTDMQAMFYGCENLVADISGFDLSSVTEIKGMFNGAPNLTLPEDIEYYY